MAEAEDHNAQMQPRFDAIRIGHGAQALLDKGIEVLPRRCALVTLPGALSHRPDTGSTTFWGLDYHHNGEPCGTVIALGPGRHIFTWTAPKWVTDPKGGEGQFVIDVGQQTTPLPPAEGYTTTGEAIPEVPRSRSVPAFPRLIAHDQLRGLAAAVPAALTAALEHATPLAISLHTRLRNDQPDIYDSDDLLQEALILLHQLILRFAADTVAERPSTSWSTAAHMLIRRDLPRATLRGCEAADATKRLVAYAHQSPTLVTATPSGYELYVAHLTDPATRSKIELVDEDQWNADPEYAQIRSRYTQAAAVLAEPRGQASLDKPLGADGDGHDLHNMIPASRFSPDQLVSPREILYAATSGSGATPEQLEPWVRWNLYLSGYPPLHEPTPITDLDIDRLRIHAEAVEQWLFTPLFSRRETYKTRVAQSRFRNLAYNPDTGHVRSPDEITTSWQTNLNHPESTPRSPWPQPTT